MAKILFFAHDPGGANAIKPLIEPLINKNNICEIYGKGPALKILPNAIEYSGNTNNLIKKLEPNFVITGTSASDMTEKELRKSAKEFNIPCMAILDHWVNYNRFTKYSSKELLLNKKFNEIEYLPDYYIVMDDYAKKEAIKTMVPEQIIYPLGNPHFKSIKDDFEQLNINSLRNRLLEGKEKLIVWASEPYLEDYGYGQELNCLNDLIEIVPDNIQLIIKPHPRECENKFKKFKNIKIVKDITSQQAIKPADVVISMTSMVLIESIIADKPTISYQKNEIDKNKFILTKMNALNFIRDKMELQKELHKMLHEKNIKSNFKIDFNATKNIIKFIEDKLCQN
ncbi:MAG: DUF354 domain-containing protein [bacterium]|nr:DUF354 domain-containing protein [bacterium]